MVVENIFDLLYIIILRLIIRLDKVNPNNYKNNRLERLGGLLKEEILKEAERIVEGDKILEQALMYNKEFLENPVLRLAYEDLLKEKTKCRDEGEEKGRVEGKLETAKNMIAKNCDNNFIKEITGLPLKVIKSLRNKED